MYNLACKAMNMPGSAKIENVPTKGIKQLYLLEEIIKIPSLYMCCVCGTTSIREMVINI